MQNTCYTCKIFFNLWWCKWKCCGCH